MGLPILLFLLVHLYLGWLYNMIFLLRSLIPLILSYVDLGRVSSSLVSLSHQESDHKTIGHWIATTLELWHVLLNSPLEWNTQGSTYRGNAFSTYIDTWGKCLENLSRVEVHELFVDDLNYDMLLPWSNKDIDICYFNCEIVM